MQGSVKSWLISRPGLKILFGVSFAAFAVVICSRDLFHKNQTPSLQSISGEWLYVLKDDPSFKERSLDDANWCPIIAPDSSQMSRVYKKSHCPKENYPAKEMRNRVFWYRKHIALSKALSDPALFVGSVKRRGWVYWDGQLIGTGGTYDSPILLALSHEQAQPGEHVVAVRVEARDDFYPGIYHGYATGIAVGEYPELQMEKAQGLLLVYSNPTFVFALLLLFLLTLFALFISGFLRIGSALWLVPSYGVLAISYLLKLGPTYASDLTTWYWNFTAPFVGLGLNIFIFERFPVFAATRVRDFARLLYWILYWAFILVGIASVIFSWNQGFERFSRGMIFLNVSLFLVWSALAYGKIKPTIRSWLSPMGVGFSMAACVINWLWIGHGAAYFNIDFYLTAFSFLILSDLICESARQWGIQERQAAVGEVSEQVAHDLRAPLGALKAVAASGGDFALGEIIRSAVTRLEKIANDVLRETRREHSSARLDECVSEIVREKVFQHQDENAPGLRFDVSSTLGITVSAAPSDLKRVLSALVDNAIHASHGSGDVLIKTSRGEDFCEVSVSDQGSGMEPSLVKRIQEGIAESQTQGNGLGLRFVRKCVAEWRGALEISSVPEQGTEVKFKVPIEVFKK